MREYQRVLKVLRSVWHSGGSCVPLITMADNAKLSLDRCRYYLRMMHQGGFVRFDNRNKITILLATSKFPVNVKDLKDSSNAHKEASVTNLWNRSSDYDLLEHELRGVPVREKGVKVKEKSSNRKFSKMKKKKNDADVDIYVSNQIVRSADLLPTVECEQVLKSALVKLLSRISPPENLKKMEAIELLMKLNDSYTALKKHMVHPFCEGITFLQRTSLLLRELLESKCTRVTDDLAAASLSAHLVVTCSYKLLSSFMTKHAENKNFDFTSEAQMIVALFVKSCYPEQGIPSSTTRPPSSKGFIAARDSTESKKSAKSAYSYAGEPLTPGGSDWDMDFTSNISPGLSRDGLTTPPPSEKYESVMDVHEYDPDDQIAFVNRADSWMSLEEEREELKTQMKAAEEAGQRPVDGEKRDTSETEATPMTVDENQETGGMAKENMEYWSKRENEGDETGGKRRSQISIEGSSAKEHMEFWTKQESGEGNDEDADKRSLVEIQDNSAKARMEYWLQREGSSNEEVPSAAVGEESGTTEPPQTTKSEQGSNVADDQVRSKSINTLTSERIVAEMANELEREKQSSKSSIATINLTEFMDPQQNISSNNPQEENGENGGESPSTMSFDKPSGGPSGVTLNISEIQSITSLEGRNEELKSENTLASEQLVKEVATELLDEKQVEGSSIASMNINTGDE